MNSRPDTRAPDRHKPPVGPLSKAPLKGAAFFGVLALMLFAYGSTLDNNTSNVSGVVLSSAGTVWLLALLALSIAAGLLAIFAYYQLPGILVRREEAEARQEYEERNAWRRITAESSESNEGGGKADGS